MAVGRTRSTSLAWLLDDAVRLHAVIPLLAQGVMLEIGAALDDHRTVDVPTARRRVCASGRIF